jgi:hypothetical protein
MLTALLISGGVGLAVVVTVLMRAIRRAGRGTPPDAR